MNESWVFFSCWLSLRASVRPAVESVPVFPKRPVRGERVSSTLTLPSSSLAWINCGCVQMLCLRACVYSSSKVNGDMCVWVRVCLCVCVCVYVACVGWANRGIKMYSLKLRDAALRGGETLLQSLRTARVEGTDLALHCNYKEMDFMKKMSSLMAHNRCIFLSCLSFGACGLEFLGVWEVFLKKKKEKKGNTGCECGASRPLTVWRDGRHVMLPEGCR